MRSIHAVFGDGDRVFGHPELKRYEYFVRDGDAPEVGDVVVTSLSVRTGAVIATARVVEVNEAASPSATKFYLYLLPMAELKARHKADADAVVKRKERAAAINRLRELAEAKTLIDSLRNSTDPEIAALIKSIEG